MGFFQRVADVFRPGPVEQPQNAGVQFSTDLMEAILRQGQGSSHWETAIQVTAILACARIKANDLASAPWKIMKDNPDGSKVEAKEHPYFDMLRRSPNPWQTGFEFRQTIGLHLALAGNAYVFLDKVGPKRDRVVGLLPLEPGSVQVSRDTNDWTKMVYDVTFPDGTWARLDSKSIWHLRDLSWNSYKGLAALQYARESIGLARDIDRSQTDQHRNQAKPSGLLAIQSEMTPEQFEITRRLIDMQVQQRLARGLPMVVDKTMEWTQLAAKASDMQSVEVKKQTFENIAIQMGILPAMIGYNGDGSQSYASVEHLFIRHNIQVRIPLFTNFEESADRWLLSAADYKAGYYNHLVDQAILRGDIKTRGEYYKVMVNIGAMTPNEVRVLENRNRMEGLDHAYMQLNMAPLDEEGMPMIAENQSVDNNLKSAENFQSLGRAFAKASPAAQQALISQLRDMAGDEPAQGA
jgi:HK97 family phage portal protein